MGLPSAPSNRVCERLRCDNSTAFASRHWPSPVWQGVLPAAAFLVFDLGAEQGVGGLLPESARRTVSRPVPVG
ncbi:hypothetical protein ACRAKI_32015 [Saccharothrix isguenensis]